MRVVCQDVSMAFTARGRALEVLRNISFHVDEQEFVCFLGPSGCGKTTLLKIIAGLLRPRRGRVEFVGQTNGNPLSAMVFQDHGLFPWLTVQDNITFGLEMLGVDRGERERRALPLIETAGLARFVHSYPHELSIGMKQRAGLVRAFVINPEILLMDEPFASLDAQTKLVLQDELLRILRDHPKPVIYVTHDIAESILLADRIIVMTGRPGQIQAEFRVGFSRPRTLAVQGTTEFSELKGRIWEEIEETVRSQARQ